MVKSKIKWTDNTQNFWMGCNKVSAGCKYCYMHRIVEGDGKDASVVWRISRNKFYRPLMWRTPVKIFTCSMSDFFINEADKWREDAWEVIRRTPQHSWQILTKRPERISECLPPDWGDGWENVWLGVSIENNKEFHRAYSLANIPAKTKFISFEPLLEQISLEEHKEVLQNFDWSIIGGESGDEEGPFGYRECRVEWIENLVEELQQNNVSVFVKQMGSYLAKELGFTLDPYKGERVEEFPAHLQIQEFPFRSQNVRYSSQVNS